MIRLLVISLVLTITGIVQGQENQNDNPSLNQATQTLDSLSWLAGSWGSEENGIETEEVWMGPKAGLMVGMNRTVSKTGKTTFEYFRLVQKDETITLLASPSGKSPTPFTLKESTDSSAAFENLKHDFPQRIIYRRENDLLVARIEGTINGTPQSMDWHWQRLDDSKPIESERSDAATKKTKPPFHGLRTVVYKVNDLDKAKQWYTDALGVKPYFDQPFYVGFNIGGYELGLDPDTESVTMGDNQPVYWGVDDCAVSYEKLLKQGAKKHSEPQNVGGSIVVATVVDPFGNVLGVIENPDFKLDQ